MLATLVLAACAAASPLPAVSIIIDDIGYQARLDLGALGLPGAYSYAVLPHSPHGASFASAAYALGRETLLHLPMQAERHNRLLGPDALTSDMNDMAIARTLDSALASVPHAVGLNNHMGSVLTREPAPMRALAGALAAYPELLFVDSRTTPHTRAAKMMRERGVPTLERDVFIDNQRTGAAIRHQLSVLAARAQQQGTALGIAHPYPETLLELRRWRPGAARVRLVPIGELSRLQGTESYLQQAKTVPVGNCQPAY